MRGRESGDKIEIAIDPACATSYHLAARETMQAARGEDVMAWRKWIVRCIVFGITGACLLAALLYQRWTNPVAVRAQIIAKLSELFPGAEVSVDAARLRLLGGIELTGLRLMRADDPEKHEFLHVPSAIFYHDKEKILDGELSLRKIELHRARLRMRRGTDGRWNLHNLMHTPAAKPQTPIPAIVIHQGTLIIEDRSDPAKHASLEVNDISLTIHNDPLPVVAIRGAANSDWLGKLQLHGQLHRQNLEANLSFHASHIPLTQALVAKFPTPCPSHVLAGLQLNATASVKGQLSYRPNQPLYYDVHCEVERGTVRHPQLPLPLDQLQAKLHCSSGELRLEKLTARSGNTEVEAHGLALLPCFEQEFEVQLDLKHVMLGDELAARLPDKIRNLHKMFQPNGPTTIHIACARNGGKWAPLSSGEPSQVSLRPEGVSLAFVRFPYPLERAVGAVDYNILNKHVQVDLTAFTGDKPVFLNGYWSGEGPQVDVKFDIHGAELPIDDKLLKALSFAPNLQKFAESFHATGKFDLKSHLRHEPGASDFRNEYHLHFRDAAIRWDNFPYPLKKVSGVLDIYPDHWEFYQFQGTHNDGHVLVQGKSIPRDDNKGGKSFGISLEITGRNIPLDEPLREALRPMPGLHKAWETFSPDGRLYFTASVKRPTEDIQDLDVHVDARGCTVQPTFFPYRIQEVQGQFHFHRQRLEITNLRARHEQVIIGLDHGAVDLHPRGGYYADFQDVQITGMVLDDEFLQSLPRKLQDCVKSLQMTDPLRIKSRLVVAQPPEQGKPPDVYWDSQIWAYNAKLKAGLEFSKVTGTLACVGRYNGRQIVGVSGNLLLDEATLYAQPFKKVQAKFQMRESAPDVLLLNLRAPIFGGDITGQFRVDFNSTLRYELNMTASQINVAEFGSHNLGPKSQLTGTASARLYLTGMGNSIDALDGNGSIDIPRGHFYNLPFLLDLLKFLGLHWPDRTAFEEFHLTYGVQGPRVSVQKLDLVGTGISLSGKGEYDLHTSKLQLDIYPMWGRVEQLLPVVVRPFPTTLSKNLLTVEVRGKVNASTKDIKYQMKPVPVIIDPLLLLRDRMMGQPGGRGETSSISNLGPQSAGTRLIAPRDPPPAPANSPGQQRRPVE